MEKLVAVLIAAPAVLLAVIGLSLLLSWPFEVAWNYVVPTVFGLKALTWLQAWALSFVGTTLFKSSCSK